MTSSLDFSMVSNNDFTVRMVITKKSDGKLLDLTGYEIKWQLFQPGTRNVLIEKTVAGGDITILNQTLYKGQFQFTLEPVDTADFNTNYYPHEATATSADDKVGTITDDDLKVSYGFAYIRRELTQQ